MNAQPKAPRGIGVESFEERRRMGFGKFINSETLRRSEHLRVSDVLRRAESGYRLTVVTDRLGTHAYVASTRKLGPNGGPCWMQVVVDGVVRYSPGGIRPRPDFYQDFDVAALEAIEIYRSSAETPIEFSGPGADCGTIVLWPRFGPPAGTSPAGPGFVRSGWEYFVGFHAGANLATLAGDGTITFGTKRTRVGPVGGAFLDIWFRRSVAFSPQILFTVKGIKTTGAGGTANISMEFLEVPLLLKTSFATGGGGTKIGLYAGPAASIRLGCGAKTTGVNQSSFSCEELFLTRQQDLGLVFGGSFGGGPVSFSLRYDVGLADLSLNPTAGPVRTRTFSILSGVALRVGGPR